MIIGLIIVGLGILYLGIGAVMIGWVPLTIEIGLGLTILRILIIFFPEITDLPNSRF